jgi:hypothetical protein
VIGLAMKTVLAKITLFTTAQGGRSSPILPLRDFGCPVFFKNAPALTAHAYDCRLLVREAGKEILPGETVKDICVVFLSPKEVLPNISVGTRFDLWEGKVIGEGEITGIIEG